MNTKSELDRIVSNWLEDRVAAPRPGGLQSALARAGETPQQRHRWLPRWFGRGRGASGAAATHGQDDSSNDRRNRSMISITAVASAAALALALTATLVVPKGVDEPDPIPGAGGSTHLVAADGSGDFTTISEAVVAAEDGDTVLVEPGRYTESFTIEKEITLAGNGVEPGDVIIAVPVDAPGPAEPVSPNDPQLGLRNVPPDPPTGVRLVGTDATLRDLTVYGQDDSVAVLVSGGAPSLDRVFVKHYGQLDLSRVLGMGLLVDHGSELTVSGSEIHHRTQVDGGSSLAVGDGSELISALLAVQGGSSASIEESGLDDCAPGIWVGGVHVVGGSDLTIRASRLTDCGIEVSGESGDRSSAAIVGNEFDLSYREFGTAIRADGEATALVEDNHMRYGGTAVAIVGADAIVRGNRLADIGTAVTISRSDALIEANTVEGGDRGIVINWQGSPVINENSVEGAASVGISVDADTSPSLSGNHVCGCGVNLKVHADAEPELSDNDICPDEAAID